MSISYNVVTSPFNVQVKLDGKVVGHIRTAATGYIYVPKGQSLSKMVAAGNALPTVAAVKRTLEDECVAQDADGSGSSTVPVASAV